MNLVTEDDVEELAERIDSSEAEAIFLSCGDMATLGVVDKLEQRLENWSSPVSKPPSGAPFGPPASKTKSRAAAASLLNIKSANPQHHEPRTCHLIVTAYVVPILVLIPINEPKGADCAELYARGGQHPLSLPHRQRYAGCYFSINAPLTWKRSFNGMFSIRIRPCIPRFASMVRSL